MVQWADWVLPHGSFLAEKEKEQEKGIKLEQFGCFLSRSNEGIKTASLFAHFVFDHSAKANVWLAD